MLRITSRCFRRSSRVTSAELSGQTRLRAARAPGASRLPELDFDALSRDSVGQALTGLWDGCRRFATLRNGGRLRFRASTGLHDEKRRTADSLFFSSSSYSHSQRRCGRPRPRVFPASR
jgi:hypothetical protein